MSLFHVASKGESELSLSFPAPWSRVLRATRALFLSISLMHQSNPTVPIVPPPGPLRAFAYLISPGGGALANFVWPGGRAFTYPGAASELLTRMWFPILI